MPYVVQSDISAQLPDDFLVEALDDDGDGVIDAGLWDEVAEEADLTVDSYLGQRYEVPFANPPALVKRAARVFALETLYLRRGFHSSEDNPWKDQADDLRKLLQKIANKQASLGPDEKSGAKSVATVTEPAKTHSANGHLST